MLIYDFLLAKPDCSRKDAACEESAKTERNSERKVMTRKFVPRKTTKSRTKHAERTQVALHSKGTTTQDSRERVHQIPVKKTSKSMLTLGAAPFTASRESQHGRDEEI